jgi:hypothetical protein
MITSKLATIIKQELHTEPLIATICKEAKWTRSMFNSVDWEAYSKAFHNLPRGKQITYSKLTHGIINTNAQNFRFYNLSDKCPCCNLTRETIPHLLTCQEEAMLAHRRNAQTKLLDKLRQHRTPECILTCIQHGLDNWEKYLDTEEEMHSPTAGTVQPIDVTLTQAYHAQTNTIGWDQFLRGRISVHWGKAFQLSQRSSKKNCNSWTANLISSLLDYTSSLWQYRKEVVHGHTKEEHRTKTLAKPKNEVASAYTAYEADRFIISRHLSSLFNKSLSEIQRMDQDYLQSWLRTYHEAKTVQENSRRRQSEAAASFFRPKTNKEKPTKKLSSSSSPPIHIVVSSSSLDGTISSNSTSPSSQNPSPSRPLLSHSSEETDSSYPDPSHSDTSYTLDFSDSFEDDIDASSKAPSDKMSSNSVFDCEDSSLDSVLLPVFP